MRYMLPLCLLCIACVADYVVPIGIPNPADTWDLHPIDTPVPTRETIAPGWFEGTPRVNSIAAGDTHDCYYVDNTQVSATDSGNTYGSPTTPRATIPNIVYAAGSYVEIHGDGATGTYVYTAAMNPRGVGTAASPIWFVGIDQPIVSGGLDMGLSNIAQISYMLFDGLHWKLGGKVDIRPRFINNTIDHIAFRNCVIRGTESESDTTGFTVGATDLADTTRTTSDVLVYNCEVSHYGDKNSPGEECGVYPKFHLTRFWILDSEIHNVAEDGFGGSHGGKRTASGYYIGRCIIRDNLTNGIDIKGMRDVIVSECTIYNHYDVWVGGVHKSSGIGQAVTFHYGGNSSGLDSYLDFPENVTLCFNTIYNARFALRTSRCGNLRVIGNVIWNMVDQPTDYVATSDAIELGGLLGDTYVAHNTIFNSDGGIKVASDPGAYNAGSTYYIGSNVHYENAVYVCTADDGTGIVGVAPSNGSYWRTIRLQIWANVVANSIEAGQADIGFSGANYPAYGLDMDYNLIYRSGGEVYFYGSDTARNLAYMQANTPHEANALNSDPMFTGTVGKVLTGSPALGASTHGTGTTAYAAHLAAFGVAVEYDRLGVARPATTGWSIGAYQNAASAVIRSMTVTGNAMVTGTLRGAQ